MTWLLIFAVLVVLLVGGAVLPRRADYQGESDAVGFPWYWVAFPVAVLALVCTLGAFLSRYAGVDIPEDDIVGLSQPYPNFNKAVQFLSNEQVWVMTGPVDATVFFWFFPVLGVACTVASVVAWRQGRV